MSLKKFDNLTDDRGEKLVTSNFKYHLKYLIEDYGEDYMYKFLSGNWKNWQQAVFALDMFDSARINQGLEYELYQNKTVSAVDVQNCIYCGSANTVVEGKQTRGLDEASTAKVVCRNCGKRFDIN